MEELATFTKVREIRDNRAYKEFVWPDEIEDEHGWQTPISEGYCIGCEPLLIDVQTANAICLLHDALTEKKQAKVMEWIAKDRAHFGRIVELAWEACGVKI